MEDKENIEQNLAPVEQETKREPIVSTPRTDPVSWAND